jgi:hypothetical protein
MTLVPVDRLRRELKVKVPEQSRKSHAHLMIHKAEKWSEIRYAGFGTGGNIPFSNTIETTLGERSESVPLVVCVPSIALIRQPAFRYKLIGVSEIVLPMTSCVMRHSARCL